MRKNLIRRTVVLVVCLAFLGVTASAAFAAKPAKASVRSTLMKPYTFFVSLFPALGDLFGKTKPGSNQSGSTGSGVVKPTDDTPEVKPPR